MHSYQCSNVKKIQAELRRSSFSMKNSLCVWKHCYPLQKKKNKLTNKNAENLFKFSSYHCVFLVNNNPYTAMPLLLFANKQVYLKLKWRKWWWCTKDACMKQEEMWWKKLNQSGRFLRFVMIIWHKLTGLTNSATRKQKGHLC